MTLINNYVHVYLSNGTHFDVLDDDLPVVIERMTRNTNVHVTDVQYTHVTRQYTK